MANIEHIANALAAAPGRNIAVEQARCTKVRHKRSSCSACVDACPEQAIHITDNRLSLASEACIGCGVCIHVCPTETFYSVAPTSEEVHTLIDECAAHDHKGELEFSCGHLRKSSIRPQILVPTPAYLDESHLIHAARAGFERIVLSVCNTPACSEAALVVSDGALTAARSLIDTFEIPCVIRLRREKDAADSTAEPGARHISERDQPGGIDYSRRAILGSAATQAKDFLYQGISAELQSRRGQDRQNPSLAQVLVDKHGNIASFQMPRQERLVDELFLLASSWETVGNPTIRSRSFARVQVSPLACTRCGACFKFCPSAALTGCEAPISSSFALGGLGSAQNNKEAKPGELFFRASDCVACGLCVDVCPLRCLILERSLETDDLFELEPVDLLAP